MGLGSLICLGSKIGGGRPRLGEIAGEERLKERTEDDLSTAVTKSLAFIIPIEYCSADVPSLRKGHPQYKDEFECVIKGWIVVSYCNRV